LCSCDCCGNSRNLVGCPRRVWILFQGSLQFLYPNNHNIFWIYLFWIPSCSYRPSSQSYRSRGSKQWGCRYLCLYCTMYPWLPCKHFRIL
jgi:hypothetical protein